MNFSLVYYKGTAGKLCSIHYRNGYEPLQIPLNEKFKYTRLISETVLIPQDILLLNIKLNSGSVVFAEIDESTCWCLPVTKPLKGCLMHMKQADENVHRAVEFNADQICKSSSPSVDHKIVPITSIVNFKCLKAIECKLMFKVSKEVLMQALDALWDKNKYLFFAMDERTNELTFHYDEGASSTLLQELDFNLAFFSKQPQQFRQKLRPNTYSPKHTSSQLSSPWTRTPILKQDLDPKDFPNEYITKFLIHESVLGCILGKQGENLSMLAKKYKVEIRIFPNENSKRCIVIITQNKASADAVRAHLEYVTQTFLIPDDSIKKNLLQVFETDTIRKLCSPPGIYSILFKVESGELIILGLAKAIYHFVNKINVVYSKITDQNFKKYDL